MALYIWKVSYSTEDSTLTYRCGYRQGVGTVVWQRVGVPDDGAGLLGGVEGYGGNVTRVFTQTDASESREI